MNTKHTLGPWIATKIKVGHGVAFDVYAENKRIVRDITVNSVEDEANAHLIAAAPEMLLALQLVAERQDLIQVDATLNRAVFEAIAKAEGKQ